MITRVNCLHYTAPAGQAEVLLVMLPGAGIKAVEFAAQGMIAAVHGLGLAVDIVVMQPDLGLYLEDGINAALHSAVIAPALARGCRRIWLLGISLGGMGALLYASAHTANIEGIVLLAPFLGTRGTIAELARAGGLAQWNPAGTVATAPEKRMLCWLQAHLARRADAPLLYLGYAQQDRFVPGHEMLARALLPERVARVSGGHDWTSWTALWRQLLGRAPFGPAGTGRSAGP